MTHPRIEMLSIGDELLDGRIADTNCVRLAHALAPVGLRLAERTTVTDDIEDIVAAGRDVVGRGTKLCVVSGGLGPTTDDLTAQALASLAGVALERDEAAAATIRRRLTERGRTVSDNHLRQADRPKGSTPVPNAKGTAPGFSLEVDGCRFVSLPGVPAEFDAMVEDAIIRPARKDGQPRPHQLLVTFGLPEAEVDRRLASVATKFPEVRLQFRVKFPEVHVSLHADPEHKARVHEAADFVADAMGVHCFARDKTSFAEGLLTLLRERNESLAAAESCTGGLITDLLTDVSGSSDVVHAGITAYANEAKKKFLGVEMASIKQHGAVSREVVLQMAHGARSLVPSTYGLAVSGIAGPGGGSANKPVGTLWYALATPQGARAEHIVLPFNRRDNKVMAAYLALDLLRKHMLGELSVD